MLLKNIPYIKKKKKRHARHTKPCLGHSKTIHNINKTGNESLTEIE